ncbi:serine hydrolase domain-containing protein [Labilibacter marinus]|uniref:serine hydrolase domain-containing protein n=1 Tax=Labilibacter marinus TaxID=1477105 RepID=UPI0009502BE1|nr:serine hydrolase domain-containing protein [Labilibacter marinus]
MKHLIITFLMLGSFFLNRNLVYSQTENLQTEALSAWIDSKLTKGIDSLNIVGATIVLIKDDSIRHLNGYGVSEIESKTAVDAHHSIFGVGSISKTFVATATMQLIEEGKLELDKDVNRYLKSFQLKYKFNDSITVRQLLLHTSGLDNLITGTAVRAEKDVAPLAQYLKEQKPLQIRPSGQIINYSNQGYALLGLIVEEVSGVPCFAYIRDNVLKPLEMNSSGFKRTVELKDNYVSSYLQKDQQLIPYKPDFKLDYPSGSLNATASDMGHYIAMLLNNGTYKGRQIIDSASVAKMYHESFKHFPKANCGRSLAFFESNWNGIGVYYHTGTAQGFNSQLTLIPEKNTGLFISVNSGNPLTPKSKFFLNNISNELLTKLMMESMDANETVNDKAATCSVDNSCAVNEPLEAIGSVDEPLEAFTGKYRYAFHGTSSLDKLGILMGKFMEMEIVEKDNTLEIPQWNDKLTPVSDLTFHSVLNRHIAFGKGVNEEISYFFVESCFEYYVWHKLKWYEPIKFQMFWLGSIVLILLIYMMASAVRRIFVRQRKSHLLKRVNFLLASLSLLFIVLLAYTLMTVDPMEFLYGIPLLLKFALVIPLIIIPLVLVGIYLLVKVIRFKELKTMGIIYQSLVLVATLLFIPWLQYYNLIGFN